MSSELNKKLKKHAEFSSSFHSKIDKKIFFFATQKNFLSSPTTGIPTKISTYLIYFNNKNPPIVHLLFFNDTKYTTIWLFILLFKKIS